MSTPFLWIVVIGGQGLLLLGLFLLFQKLRRLERRVDGLQDAWLSQIQSSGHQLKTINGWFVAILGQFAAVTRWMGWRGAVFHGLVQYWIRAQKQQPLKPAPKLHTLGKSPQRPGPSGGPEIQDTTRREELTHGPIP